MYINKIEVCNFKPMLISGTSFISITDINNIVVFIGANGSGKSTLLKEITPFPATSTDYEPDGYKELTIDHNNSKYIIRSSFDGKKGEHSFIKDDVELNESKTSNVQNDLCVSEFGLTNIIKSIINGSVEICNMGKAERKQLLLSCYPSNLSFILTHHKRIVSEMKTIKDNLKLLNVRRVELESSIMPEDAYKIICTTMEQLNEIKDNVNKTESRFIDEINRMQTHPEYNPTITNMAYARINEEIKYLNIKSSLYRLSKPELFKKPYKEELIGLTTSREFISNNLNNVSEEIHNLNVEIEKFERMSKELSEDKIKEYELNITLLKSELAKKELNDNLPILSPVLARSIDLKILSNYLSQVHSLGSGVLTQNDYNELVYEIGILTNKKTSLSRELEHINTTLKNTQLRLNKVIATKFNNTCLDLVCPARDKYKETLDSLQQEELSSLERIEEYTKTIDTIDSEIEDKTSKAETAKPYLHIVTYIYELLTKLELTEYILKDKRLIDILNTNPLSISNSLTLIVENSIVKDEVDELTKRVEELESKLLSLLEAKKETINIVGTSISVKKNRLTILSEQYNNIQNKLSTLDKSIIDYKDIEDLSLSISETKTYFDSNIIPYLINEKIKVLKATLSDILEYKNIVEDEQISIKTTIKDNEAIKIRLEQEIIPTINELTEEYKKIEILEKALSPVSGIPHIYMVRFINNIVSCMNTLTDKVWNYEMKLVPLKEDKSLEFDFEIKLYENKILKDINMLSKGQKEMINLSFTFALFIIMKLSETYPMKLDEMDSGLSHQHRDKLINLIVALTHNRDIGQLFIVNHNVHIYTSMANSQIICLSPEGILLPSEFNTNTIIK